MRMPLRVSFCGRVVVFALLLLLAWGNLERATAAPGTEQTASLRAAIEDLIATFGARYADGNGFLAELNVLERQLASDRKRKESLSKLESLRVRALRANPLVSGQPLLFVVRKQYRPDHHNTATMFQNGEINTGSFEGGGALKTIDFKNGGKVETLLELPEGIVRDPEMSFDGKRVIVSLRNNRADDYHIHELDLNSHKLRQLTSGTGVSDIDPLYLPDGKILFTSTREPKYCMCNRHIMGNLFTMDGNGDALEQIGHSTLHEGHAALLPDGRVIYDRWEYVDRNFGDAQGVWSTNPDGTNHAIFWGNSTNSPGGVLDTRAIPGTQLFVATFSSCHDRPWGALAIVDRQVGLDGKTPVVRTWPPSAIDLIGKGNYDTFKKVRPKYEDPYPLSEKYILCSRMTGQGEQTGIYLVDTFGNEILLHSEGAGCFDAMPRAPRSRPPAVTSVVESRKDEGYFYIADVYDGTGMDEIPRGTIKSVRVVESPEKRFWTHQAFNGSGTQAPGMAWNDFNNKRILGTAPVETDGSAYFTVPADTYVFFQLLDERGMMIQSMRSGTIVRPGERIGCVGCHENRRKTVPNRPLLAMTHAPQRLKPWHGAARKFNYVAEVQPVFDAHCVSCHDYGKLAGEKLNLAGDLGMVFNTSYFELRSKNFVRVVGAGPATVLSPKRWGSPASPLAKILLEGHDDPKIDKQIHLDAEGFDRIVTWIDINAPYYPDYASAYPENRYGRAPISNAQLKRLSELTGVDLHQQGHSAAVSFTRPELSPALAKIKTEKPDAYREALAIVRAGAEALAARPRADMPGFTPSATDQNRQKRYLKLLDDLRATSKAR